LLKPDRLSQSGEYKIIGTNWDHSSLSTFSCSVVRKFRASKVCGWTPGDLDGFVIPRSEPDWRFRSGWRVFQMKIIESTDAAHAHVRERIGKSVLVPTMGALHRGHLELIRVAREHAGNDGEVAVSIFVNPLQFEPGSDFEKYPRPEPTDEKFCVDAGVNLLFRPREMYFDDRSVYVEETRLSAGLCGAARPGHFRGVCTVVTKLFNLLAPAAAVFGRKDYQQRRADGARGGRAGPELAQSISELGGACGSDRPLSGHDWCEGAC